MKKSLRAALVMMALVFGSLPFALLRIRVGKEHIPIAEETLCGDASAAQGIALRIASHWDGHLLWTTEYAVGSGKAESSFTFSAGRVSWGRTPQKAAGLLLGTGNSVLAAAGNSQPDQVFFSQIMDAVEQRTERGNSRRETVRIGDYYAFYPVSFTVEGGSVYFEGEYEKGCEYLTDFFHIGTLEDRMEVQVEKDPGGEVVSVHTQLAGGDKKFGICSASAFCENGLYYTYYLEDPDTGELVDRGQNMGVFYFPYVENKGVFCLDVMQVEKVCELPEHVTPLQLLPDEERNILYLAAKEENSYCVFVYALEGKTPVLTQRVSGSREDQAFGDMPVRFARMTLTEGGLLLTWSDNRFSFVAWEGGTCRWWCDGEFPDVREDRSYENPLFPWEHICVFDGKRLVLAAFAERYSLNAVLAVYQEDGCSYSGLYRYPVETDENGGSMAYDRLHRILPQGVTWGDFSPGADICPLEIVVE